MEYPEHEKMSAIKDQSQAIGQFLDWLLHEQGIHLAEYVDDQWDGQQLFPHRLGIEGWLAKYFNIDLDVIEQEKRDMLDEIRRAREAVETQD